MLTEASSCCVRAQHITKMTGMGSKPTFAALPANGGNAEAAGRLAQSTGPFRRRIYSDGLSLKFGGERDLA